MTPHLFERRSSLQRREAAHVDPTWVERTVLFIDVVESVRLMEGDESGTLRRWRQLTASIERDVLPPFQGRLVKKLGDGLMADFPDVSPAIRAAFAIQAACNDANAGLTADQRILVRIGGHSG